MAKTAKQTTTKQPKSITVKTLLPWAIIALTVALSAGFILGWHTRTTVQQRVQAEARQLADFTKQQ